MTVELEQKLNLTYTDQLTYLSGLHRSGWPFVMSQLERLQKVDDGVWCDTYVDRTFHWAHSKLIPYNRPWIGFIHHTFDTTHSDYNNVNLLKNSDFLESLIKCKGIFVFSSAQKLRWDLELSMRGYSVPVTSLVHPTESVPLAAQFTIEKFLENPDKKVISVGAWLRNTYAIYELNNGNSPVVLTGENEPIVMTKAALQGPQMHGYFKPLNFFRIFTQPGWRNFDFRPPVFAAATIPNKEHPSTNTSQQRVTSVNGELPEGLVDTAEDASDESGGMCRDNMCRDVMCRDSTYTLNKYVAGAVKHLRHVDDSVTVLPTASNADYDNLLTQNVIFLNLIDSAAVNTVLECLVRNTPIFVNMSAASVVELLGADYPLFYNSLDDVKDLFTLGKVKAAHEYLRSLNKEFITGDHFIKTLTSSQIYQAL